MPDKSKIKAFLSHHLTFRKLTFMVLFYGIHMTLFAIGWWKQAKDPRLAPLNTLGYSVWFSRGAGLVLSFDVAIILLPMCRTLVRFFRPKITFIPLDESKWFHQQVAYQMLIYTVIHVASHYVNFFNVEKSQIRPELAVQIHYTQPGGITGHIMLFCMLLMYTTAHAKIRRQSFEAFWYTHHLFIPFLLATYTHATGCFVRDTAEPFSPFDFKGYWTHCLGYSAFRWELVGAALYLAERLYREVRARRPTEIFRVVRHPFRTVEIQFVKSSMKYTPGQWLFINCPQVSYFQWHPFTITSCPRDNYISIHMRQVGDFTRSFANAVGAGEQQDDAFEGLDPMGQYQVAIQKGNDMPAIRVDGPFGAPAEDVFNNEVAVLIGTGIGVTPWASILKTIWHLRESGEKMKLKKVEFVWICPDTTSFEWLQTLLRLLEEQKSASEPKDYSFLTIRMCLTAKLPPAEVTNITLNSVGAQFDPVTGLKSRTYGGRPDFPAMFGEIAELISSGSYLPTFDRSAPVPAKTTVGVFFCGPSVAARTINNACHSSTTAGVKFKFWKEHF